ncbi:MAG: DUF2809 domain-containing protein [Pseudomonadota bacterium]
MSAAERSGLRRRRLVYALITLGIVACGLIWRRPELGLPQLVAKYGGSMLWGAMVFFVIATLLPSAKLFRIGIIAAVVAAGVEFSQLIQIEWLDQFRRTAIGALMLGRTFTWWDIAAYWAGIALACAGAITFQRTR